MHANEQLYYMSQTQNNVLTIFFCLSCAALQQLEVCSTHVVHRQMNRPVIPVILLQQFPDVDVRETAAQVVVAAAAAAVVEVSLVLHSSNGPDDLSLGCALVKVA